MGRRGPQTAWALDRQREQVVGLRERKDGRFYAVADDGKHKTFGSQRDDAIRRFRAWESDRKGKRLRLTDSGPPSESVRKSWEHESEHHVDPAARDYYRQALDTNRTIKTVTIAEAGFWDEVRRQIIHNPKLAAQKTGIEQLAYLTDLKPPAPSAKLEALRDCYTDDKRHAISGPELQKSKTWWNEFMSIAKAQRVSDLTLETFRRYRQQVKVDQGKMSNSYTRSRFGKVIAIIRHAEREMDLSPQDRQVLTLKSLLKKPPAPTSKPVDLEREELEKILDKAQEFDLAMILVALNCCFYPIDVIRLRWDMLDLDKGVLCFDREKSAHLTKGAAIVRVAVLWKRTVSALRAIKHEGEFVFMAEYGQLGPARPNKRFNKLLTAAGIKRKLHFANLRDSGQTRAAEAGVPAEQYRVLAGHKLPGVDDNYIRRNPNFVRSACEAIERYYFGG